MRKSLLSTTAVCTLVAALAAAPVPAAAGSYTAATLTFKNTGGLDWNPSGANSAAAMASLPSFNTALGGNLKSVLVVENLTSKISGQAQFTGASPTPATVTANSRVWFGNPSSLMPPGLAPATSAGRVLRVKGNLAYYTHTTTTSNGKKLNLTKLNNTSQPFASGALAASNSFAINASTTSLANWETNGHGNVNLALHSTTTGTWNLTRTTPTSGHTFPAFGLNFSPAVTETLTATIKYFYTGSAGPTSAPEPASALLLGGGLLALGKVRRRKQRTQS
ncbi:MAG TPA: VPLPA-CTERM sorting domain-containing protein [Acetobacteraceae bacterium]|nr:VPLPA-CTERM sorting domain-containing protein [Acetobacteraceae bacterium]